jgi:hypothetical protein
MVFFPAGHSQKLFKMDCHLHCISTKLKALQLLMLATTKALQNTNLLALTLQ